MTRQIKFRIWNPKTKEITPDWPLMLSSNSLHPTYLNQTINKDIDDGYVFMQFTGLHDKNGKEIYEGDIVHNISTKEKGYAVPQGWVGTVFYSIDRFLLDCGGAVILSIKEPCEIIGNIYENPELLK